MLHDYYHLQHCYNDFLFQAFGVGALEEEDDDIYAVDHLSNYDISMGGEDERGDTFGWTAPGRGRGKGERGDTFGWSWGGKGGKGGKVTFGS